MRKTGFLTLLLLSVFPIAGNTAETFEEFLKKAEQAENLQVRFEYFDKALEAASAEQKKLAARNAFDAATRAGSNELRLKYAGILAVQPGLSDAERAEAVYYSLYLLSPSSWHARYTGKQCAEPQQWLDFLKMPGITPQQEYNGLLRLARDCMNDGLYAISEDSFLKACSHPCAPENAKPGIMVEYIESLRLQCKRPQALQKIDELIGKKMAVSFRIRLLLTKILVLTQSPEYYFEPSPEDIQAAYAIYEDIRKMPLKMSNRSEAAAYCNAMRSYVNFCFLQNDFARTEQAAERILTDKKHPVDRATWLMISTWRARALTKLRRFPEAISILEKLSDMKYETADSLRYLGEAYYGNGDYTLAIGAFKTALDILLERHADDDRPVWCENWVKKLSWFTEGAKELDRVIKKHEKRIGVAETSGKSASDGVKSPMRKTKKKVVRDLKDISSGVGEITDDGIQLD